MSALLQMSRQPESSVTRQTAAVLHRAISPCSGEESTTHLYRIQLSVRQLSVAPIVKFPSSVRVDILAQQFGNVIRRCREAAGLSQEDLAERAGLHRTYISMLERGLRMPSILVVKQLARALATTMASILDEVERGH